MIEFQIAFNEYLDELQDFIKSADKYIISFAEIIKFSKYLFDIL